MEYLYLAGIFLCLAIKVQMQNACSPPITDDHLKYLDEMIDAQLNPSCLIQIKLLDINQVEGYCFKRGVISQLSVLLERLEFKPNSQSYNHTKILNDLYNQRFMDCIGENEYITQEDLSPCSRSIDLSPAQILERIKMSFLIFRDFEANSKYENKCFLEYCSCKEESDATKGPQCAFLSPTTPILSSTANQKFLSNLPEIKNTPYSSIIPISTAPLTEYMSGTDSDNPQQSSESVEMSSVILTSKPAEVQPLTTIMDHLHAATTDRLVSGPETPHTKTDISQSGTEFTKVITESTNTMSLSQTRTNPGDFNLESLNTDGSPTERLSTTTVLNKDFFQQTGELLSVTEPVVDELLETTELNNVLQSLVSNCQAESSMETGIESSSSSTVTKMRRSVENVDKTIKVYVSTPAHPVLTSDDGATKLPYVTLSIPPTLKSTQTMSQESKTRNLAWAASYVFPAMVTNKPTTSEAKMSSPVSGVQSLPSETSLHPKLTAHKGGHTYNNDQQQEQNVAAFTSEDKETKGTGPIHDFNQLPILKTEQHQNGRQNNLFLVMIPSILAILFLCGLLYVMYRYRLLRRQLKREQVPELPELRPLAE